MAQLTEIVLKGTERIEELSEEWHKQYGLRNREKCYKSIMQFVNPLDSTDPVIHESWPLIELPLQPGETREARETFFIYDGGIYTLVQGTDPVKRVFLRYLKGCTKKSRPFIDLS